MWRILVLALCLGLCACSGPAPVGFRNTDISGSEIGDSLAAFKDQYGRATSLADFKGKAVVVFFGYTTCPDVCPTTLARLAEAMKRLGTEAEHVQVLMVTVDPEHDTPKKLGDYMAAFDPTFIGLIGDRPTTEAAAKAFKVFVATESAVTHEHGHEDSHQQSAAPAQIDHSAASYVFDPTGRIRLYVKDDASSDAITSDLKRLLSGA